MPAHSLLFTKLASSTWLKHCFGSFSILVPPVVALEVAPSLGALPTWIEVGEVVSIPSMGRMLDAGERAAIALASQIDADLVILDDLAGRTTATELGLPTTGSLGLLVRAKQSGRIDEVRPLMDAMISQGLYASETLYRQILEIAGETP